MAKTTSDYFKIPIYSFLTAERYLRAGQAAAILAGPYVGKRILPLIGNADALSKLADNLGYARMACLTMCVANDIVGIADGTSAKELKKGPFNWISTILSPFISVTLLGIFFKMNDWIKPNRVTDLLESGLNYKLLIFYSAKLTQASVSRIDANSIKPPEDQESVSRLEIKYTLDLLGTLVPMIVGSHVKPHFDLITGLNGAFVGTIGVWRLVHEK